MFSENAVNHIIFMRKNLQIWIFVKSLGLVSRNLKFIFFSIIHCCITVFFQVDVRFISIVTLLYGALSRMKAGFVAIFFTFGIYFFFYYLVKFMWFMLLW